MRAAVSAWFWDSLTTGSGQYTRRLVEALARLEPDLEIHLVEPGPRSLRASTRRFGGGEPARSPRSRQPRTNPSKLWFEQLAFPLACRRLRADVAHVPYWAPPLVSTVPTVVTIHDLIPLLLPAYRGGGLVRAYTGLVSRAARRADLVLTDSEAAQQDIREHLGLPAERVRAVHLAASEAYGPQPRDSDDAVRERLGLPDAYVLYLGGFDVRKNVRTALEAYRSAGQLGDTCPLVIAGKLPEHDTAFAPDPRRLATDLGIGERHVRFLGRVNEADKPALYRGALTMLFPSHYEGFGLPPLEAMTCGTPVVGSNTASMPEVVGAGGLLFDPEDAHGMAGALIRLAADASFRAQLSQRAVAKAATFSWQRTAAQTLTAYRDAISARS